MLFYQEKYSKKQGSVILLLEINIGNLERENWGTELSTPSLTQLYIFTYLHI